MGRSQDELGEDVIAIRPIMNLTLTYDHRLVDGALAGRFLRDLRERLESWGEKDYGTDLSHVLVTGCSSAIGRAIVPAPAT